MPISEDRFQQTIRAGEKNLKTLKLIRNWCSHAKVVKHGGVGLIERETGLPIGHHFIECPHASAGGMAAWDLADTAVDFYDRNCFDCKLRKPVGLPNLSEIIAERDRAIQSRQSEKLQNERLIAERLASREALRATIRQHLNALQCTTLDHIGELDRTRSKTNATALVELSQLAPETFAPLIIEHVVTLASSQEYWLVEPSLQVLERLCIDGEVLCSLALKSLQSHDAVSVAARIAEKYADQANPLMIEDALPAIIHLANPAQSPFSSQQPRTSMTGPLRRLHEAHPDAVKEGLRHLLEYTDAEQVSIGARGLTVVLDRMNIGAGLLERVLVSKIARAHLLIRGRDDAVDDAITEMVRVVTRIFLENPEVIDRLISEYKIAVTDEGQSRLFKVYESALRELRFPDRDGKMQETKGRVNQAHRLAFRRMVVLATTARGYEVQSTASSLFNGDPYALTQLVEEETDLLLGNSAILNTALDEHETNKPEQADELTWVTRQNYQSYLTSLMNSFVRWTCITAGKSPASVIIVLEFMKALPEQDTRLRGAIIGEFAGLMNSTDNLLICLPEYYSAMVGSSQLVRAYAATTMSKIRAQLRDDMPSLVFEAFSTLLQDSYVIVHQAAVRSLATIEVPEDLRSVVTIYIYNLINTYMQSRSDDDFVIECVQLCITIFLKREQVDGQAGAALIDILMRLAPGKVARRLRYRLQALESNAMYPDLLFRLLCDREAMSYQHEEILTSLHRIPLAEIQTHRDQLIAFGNQAIQDGKLQELDGIIELLTASGGWSEAAQISATAFDGIADNVRERPRRLRMRLRSTACTLESAISKGDLHDVQTARTNWDATVREIRQDDETFAERRDPLRGLLSKN